MLGPLNSDERRLQQGGIIRAEGQRGGLGGTRSKRPGDRVAQGCAYWPRVCVHACMLSPFSRAQLFVTLGTIARQAPLSMGFSRQEYWSELPLPSPGDLPNSGMEAISLMSLALAGRFFSTSATWEAHIGPKSQLKLSPTPDWLSWVRCPPCSISSGQGSCGLWVGPIHWEELWIPQPSPPRNSSSTVRTLQGLSSDTALSNRTHRNILVALLMYCFN